MKIERSKSKSSDDKTIRTTLSITASLSRELRAIAEEKHVHPMDLVRSYLEQCVALHKIGLEETKALQSHYQKMVASWRLGRASQQLSLIGALRLELDAFPGKVYLLKVLTELVGRLDEHDEFLVVSNLEFWRTGGSAGVYGEPLPLEAVDCYLFAQQKAIQRGMSLSRIFVLGGDTSDAHGVLPRHKEFLETAWKECSNCTPRVEVRVNKSLLPKELPIFACIRHRKVQIESVALDENDQECLVIEPIFEKERFRLRLLFSRGPGNVDPVTNEYINNFFRTRSKSDDLLQWSGSPGELSNSKESPTLRS